MESRKMKDQNAVPAPQVDAIHHVAERARALRHAFRWVVWTGVPFMITIVATTLVQILAQAFLRRQINTDMAYVCAALLLIPVLSAVGWMVVEQVRLHKAFSELRGIFVPGRRDVRQIAPPSAIGPLLEATLAEATLLGVWEDSEIEGAAELLGALLRSVRAEEEVVLTEDQRKRLHELVMPGRWDYWFTGAGGVGGKNTVVLGMLRHKLRPDAIAALAFLGNSSSIPVLERFAGKTDDPQLKQSALQSVEQIRARLQYDPEQRLRGQRA
jgi:hypothetical protein